MTPTTQTPKERLDYFIANRLKASPPLLRCSITVSWAFFRTLHAELGSAYAIHRDADTKCYYLMYKGFQIIKHRTIEEGDAFILHQNIARDFTY